MLGMAAFEIGNPVLMFILVKPGYFSLLHAGPLFAVF